MSDGPYEACHTSSPDAIFGVSGPGEGLGYYAWYQYPSNTFTSYAAADQAARMMNMAFARGKRARSEEIRELIG